MRRAVITGLGIVSCLGNDKNTVAANLRAGHTGIRFNPYRYPFQPFLCGNGLAQPCLRLG